MVGDQATQASSFAETAEREGGEAGLLDPLRKRKGLHNMSSVAGDVATAALWSLLSLLVRLRVGLRAPAVGLGAVRRVIVAAVLLPLRIVASADLVTLLALLFAASGVIVAAALVLRG